MTTPNTTEAILPKFIFKLSDILPSYSSIILQKSGWKSPARLQEYEISVMQKYSKKDLCFNITLRYNDKGHIVFNNSPTFSCMGWDTYILPLHSIKMSVQDELFRYIKMNIEEYELLYGDTSFIYVTIPQKKIFQDIYDKEYIKNHQEENHEENSEENHEESDEEYNYEEENSEENHQESDQEYNYEEENDQESSEESDEEYNYEEENEQESSEESDEEYNRIKNSYTSDKDYNLRRTDSSEIMYKSNNEDYSTEDLSQYTDWQKEDIKKYGSTGWTYSNDDYEGDAHDFRCLSGYSKNVKKDIGHNNNITSVSFPEDDNRLILKNFRFHLNEKTRNSYILYRNFGSSLHDTRVWALFKGQRPLYYSDKYRGWIVSLSNRDLLEKMGARIFG